MTAGSDIGVLAALARGEAHGHELLGRLTRAVDSEDTLYRTLERLEQAGYVRSRIEAHGGGRRRVYALTARGKRSVAEQRTLWRGVIRALRRLAVA